MSECKSRYWKQKTQFSSFSSPILCLFFYELQIDVTEQLLALNNLANFESRKWVKIFLLFDLLYTVSPTQFFYILIEKAHKLIRLHFFFSISSFYIGTLFVAAKFMAVDSSGSLHVMSVDW
jgi:hypothetical protein